MILTPEEITFLAVYCYEGTQPPFGGPATDAMDRIGVHDGDTLNLQWAYLRDKPPTGPVIGMPSKVVPPLPWASREEVLRRDAEIQAVREASGHPATPATVMSPTESADGTVRSSNISTARRQRGVL